MRTSLILLLFLVPAMTGRAQIYRVQATLPQVSKDGFYRIALTSDLTQHDNQLFQKLRIIDSKQAQVPYLLGEDRETGSREFISYIIESQNVIEDSCTVLILRNAEKTPINNLKLIVKNTNVHNFAVLSGSDDNKKWYGVKERFLIGRIDNPNGTFDVQTINFPMTDYKYYKLYIDDSRSGALNILQAGFYCDVSGQTNYSELKIKSVTQVEDPESKTSYVRIQLDTMQIIDKLTWEIDAPFFLRNAHIFTESTVKRKAETLQVQKPIADFQLNSRHEAVFYFGGQRLDNLLIKIENEDNPPLLLSDIKLFQTNRYATAWLKGGETYVIKFGDDHMESPYYDIQFFKDMIPSKLQTITPGKSEQVKMASLEESATIFTSRVYIWVAIVMIALVLAYMSLKMIRETKTSP
jgi:hypothetical protein